MAVFGERLRALRDQLGVSQMQLGKLMGISQVAVNRYEHSDAEPPFRILTWYADYFDVSLDWILCRTDEPRGIVYQGRVPINEDAKQFIDACFVPGSPLNARLKEKLIELWKDNS